MFGNNPLRPPLKGDGSTLDIQEIFATLQGEGPYAGWPAVFIRLGGCNLACRFCDTEFESFRQRPLNEILSEVDALRRSPKGNIQGQVVRRLAVITGGEPLRQPIAPLCEGLLAMGMQVQLETNGTLYRPLPEAVEWVCSPKRSASFEQDASGAAQPYAPLREDVLARTRALKFIVSRDFPGYQDVSEVGQTRFNIPVYVQPMDEGDAHKNAANRAWALVLAEQYGYRLSLQTHKILGIA